MRLGDRAEHTAVTELFEVVFEQEAMGMALRAVDPNNSRWLRVNQKFCDMLGYTREELLQLTSVEISLPDERHLAVKYNEQLLRGDLSSYSREKRYLRKDGTEIWTNIWLSPVLDRDGNPTQIISVIHDITESKRAEEVHKQSLEEAIESISDGFSFYNAEGKLVLCNQKQRDFFPYLGDIYRPGVDREEIIRRHATERHKKDPTFDVEDFIHERLKLVNAPRQDKEYQLLDGRWVVMRERAVAGGGLVSIRTDITEHKQAETALLKSQEDLQQALDKEQQLNKLQREFVSMASHEFRAPLAIIDTTAQRLKRRADSATPEEAARRADKIRAAVQRMIRLMESTLDAARMEGGVIKVEIKPCDIDKVVREVCARQQEISKTHIILCELAGLPETIQADTGSLEQVLANLLSNAVKYAPDAPEIEVKAHTEGDQVVISVRDHGVGIDEDELGRVGERFFRAKTSTGTAGTGIGLNLAKTLVEMHGGSVGVESKKGEGSTFTIRLPIAGPDRSEQADTKTA